MTAAILAGLSMKNSGDIKKLAEEAKMNAKDAKAASEGLKNTVDDIVKQATLKAEEATAYVQTMQQTITPALTSFGETLQTRLENINKNPLYSKLWNGLKTKALKFMDMTEGKAIAAWQDVKKAGQAAYESSPLKEHFTDH